jgi:hypothetical protein
MPPFENMLQQFDAVFQPRSQTIFSILSILVKLGMLLQCILAIAHDHGVRAFTKTLVIITSILFMMHNFDAALIQVQDTVRVVVTDHLKADPASVRNEYAQMVKNPKARKKPVEGSSIENTLGEPPEEEEEEEEEPFFLSREGIQKAIIDAFMWVMSMGALLLQYGLLFIQKFLTRGAYALSPIWFAMFCLDSQRGNAIRYGLHLLAICLWPMSWAVASLGTQFLMDNFVYVEKVDFGIAILKPAQSDLILFLQILIIPLIAFWIIITTIIGPILLHILIPSGGHYALQFATTAISRVAGGSANSSRK